MREARRRHRATVAGMLIGSGMGGFVDGIMLHQMAQWHNMLSNVIPPHTMDDGISVGRDRAHSMTCVSPSPPLSPCMRLSPHTAAP
jgi:Predicted membrane protein (DUF2243)